MLLVCPRTAVRAHARHGPQNAVRRFHASVGSVAPPCETTAEKIDSTGVAVARYRFIRAETPGTNNAAPGCTALMEHRSPSSGSRFGYRRGKPIVQAAAEAAEERRRVYLRQQRLRSRQEQAIIQQDVDHVEALVARQRLMAEEKFQSLLPASKTAEIAKKSLRWAKGRRFVGIIKSYVEGKWGFISCAHTKKALGGDVFVRIKYLYGTERGLDVDPRTMPMKHCVGDAVRFSVENQESGKPHAVDLEPAEYSEVAKGSSPWQLYVRITQESIAGWSHIKTHQHFSKFGVVVDVQPARGRPHVFFVHFSTRSAMMKALKGHRGLEPRFIEGVGDLELLQEAHYVHPKQNAAASTSGDPLPKKVLATTSLFGEKYPD